MLLGEPGCPPGDSPPSTTPPAKLPSVLRWDEPMSEGELSAWCISRIFLVSARALPSTRSASETDISPVDGLRELEDLLVARVRLRLGLPELAQLPALAVVSHADDEGKASQRRQHDVHGQPHPSDILDCLVADGRHQAGGAVWVEGVKRLKVVLLDAHARRVLAERLHDGGSHLAAAVDRPVHPDALPRLEAAVAVEPDTGRQLLVQ
eukprot:scaffold22381_cov118-Isochrysis_galbana.AAC.10